MKYALPKEHILLGDLEPEVVETRKRLCASDKMKFAWMRFDTCSTQPKKSTKSGRAAAITSSRDVSHFLHNAVLFAGRNREFFMILCVDSKNVPIAVAAPHVGGRASAAVDASVVLQACLLAGGMGFMIAHNHPSGVPTPSDADIELTKSLVKGCNYVGLNMLDHVILTDDPSIYFSFLDRGIMPRVT